ncbi:DNA-binding protein [Terrabacter sp. NPDC080008]|uniref:helix-turn-helix transcriptional regulator n=1 Tax=Terrabacter sp. NPDC080008 TaxID=3155176 RepID=UPI00344FA80A
MHDKHLTPKMLADRWGMSAQTLANHRSLGTGPAYLKLGQHVAYRLSDIEAYEAERVVAPVRAHARGSAA